MKKDKEGFEKEIISTYLKNRVKKYDPYFELPVQFYRIPEDAGMAFMTESCNGFCPECEKMLQCETYKETKDAWDRFCS